MSRRFLVALVVCCLSASSAFAQSDGAQQADEPPAAEAEPGSRAKNEKATLLVMRFKAADTDAITAAGVEDITSDVFASSGRFAVQTGSDLEELMALESNKAMAGCDDSECLAELAGALGADYVVTGRISRLGELYVVKLALLEPLKARTLGSETIEADSLEKLAPAIRRAGGRLTAAAFGEAVPKELERNASRVAGLDGEDEGGGGGSGIIGSTLMWSAFSFLGVGLLAGLTSTLAMVSAGAVVWFLPTSPGLAKAGFRWVGNVGMATALFSVSTLVAGGFITVAWMITELVFVLIE